MHFSNEDTLYNGHTLCQLIFRTLCSVKINNDTPITRINENNDSLPRVKCFSMLIKNFQISFCIYKNMSMQFINIHYYKHTLFITIHYNL